MATLRPLQNYLVIDKIEDDLTTSGGIALVRAGKSVPCIGRVVAIGPGAYDEENDVVRTCGVDVGDYIAYLKPEAKTFNIDNEKVTMLRGSGVLGKVDGRKYEE